MRTGAKGFFHLHPGAELHLNTRVGQGDIPQALEFIGENIRNGGRGINKVIVCATLLGHFHQQFFIELDPHPERATRNTVAVLTGEIETFTLLIRLTVGEKQ